MTLANAYVWLVIYLVLVVVPFLTLIAAARRVSGVQGDTFEWMVEIWFEWHDSVLYSASNLFQLLVTVGAALLGLAVIDSCRSALVPIVETNLTAIGVENHARQFRVVVAFLALMFWVTYQLAAVTLCRKAPAPRDHAVSIVGRAFGWAILTVLVAMIVAPLATWFDAFLADAYGQYGENALLTIAAVATAFLATATLEELAISWRRQPRTNGRWILGD